MSMTQFKAFTTTVLAQHLTSNLAKGENVEDAKQQVAKGKEQGMYDESLLETTKEGRSILDNLYSYLGTPRSQSSLGTTSASSTNSSVKSSLANSYGDSLASTASIMERQKLMADNTASATLSSGSLLGLGGTL